MPVSCLITYCCKCFQVALMCCSIVNHRKFLGKQHTKYMRKGVMFFALSTCLMGFRSGYRGIQPFQPLYYKRKSFKVVYRLGSGFHGELPW